VKTFAVLVTVLLGGCDDTTYERTESLTYSFDSRTGLCFASRSLSMNNAVLTNVPCNPHVRLMIACARNFGEQSDRCRGLAAIEDVPPVDAGR